MFNLQPAAVRAKMLSKIGLTAEIDRLEPLASDQHRTARRRVLPFESYDTHVQFT